MLRKKTTNSAEEWRKYEDENPKGTLTISMDSRYLLVKTRKRNYLFDITDQVLMTSLRLHSPLLFGPIFVDKDFLYDSGMGLRRQAQKFFKHPTDPSITMIKNDNPFFSTMMISYDSISALEDARDDSRLLRDKCFLFHSRVMTDNPDSSESVNMLRSRIGDFEILKVSKEINGIEHHVKATVGGVVKYYYGLDEFMWEEYSHYVPKPEVIRIKK